MNTPDCWRQLERECSALGVEIDRYRLIERAAIKEHDGGLPRHEAEQEAADEYRMEEKS